MLTRKETTYGQYNLINEIPNLSKREKVFLSLTTLSRTIDPESKIHCDKYDF